MAEAYSQKVSLSEPALGSFTFIAQVSAFKCPLSSTISIGPSKTDGLVTFISQTWHVV